MTKLINALRAAGVGFSRDGCAFLAQAIAFNAVFAVFPLTVLAIAVLAFIYGNAEGQRKAFELIGTVAPELQDILRENLRNVVAYRGLSGFIALIGLIWTGKNLFLALSYALDRALGVPKGRPLLHDIGLSLVMLPVVGILLVVATLLPVAINIVAGFTGFEKLAGFPQVASYAGSSLIVFLVSALLYSFLPNRTPRWWFGIPGAVLSAVAWNVIQVAFAIYSAHVNFTQVYGAIAAIVAALLWFYITGAIFLYGAEFCAEWYEERTPVEAAQVREAAAPALAKTDA